MDSNAAWKHLVAILKPFWYSVAAYDVRTGAEFAQIYARHLSDDAAAWIAANVRWINRQCDSYGVEFAWEPEACA